MKRLMGVVLRICLVLALLPAPGFQAAARTAGQSYLLAAEGSDRLVVDGKWEKTSLEHVRLWDGMMFLDVQSFTDRLGGVGSYDGSGFRLHVKGRYVSGSSSGITLDSEAVQLPAPRLYVGRWYAPVALFGEAGLGYPVTEYPAYRLVVLGTAPAEAETLVRLFGIYVSPTGDDHAQGTPYAPVRTPDAAAKLARQHREAVNACGMDMYVFFTPGTYPPLSLESADSGTAGHPVHYCALEEGTVQIANTQALPAGAFSLSEDTRIPDAAKGRVYQANLTGLLGAYTPYPDLTYLQDAPADYYQLYDGGKKQQLARYPNEGWLRIGSVLPGIDPSTGQTETPEEAWGICVNSTQFTIDDTRLSYWSNAQDLVFAGYWGYYWSYQPKAAAISGDMVTLDSKTHFGIRPGNPVYAMNLLEELDTPGEWYLDSQTKILYYYPHNGNLEQLELAVDIQPVLQLSSGLRYLSLEGLCFEKSRYGGKMEYAEQIDISNCTFCDLGSNGLEIRDGKGIVLSGCTFYNLGGAGARFAETDAQKAANVSLSSSKNIVKNCHIYTYNQIYKTVEGGIVFYGNGGVIQNNCIHDAPHSGIYFAGNDITVQNNEVYDVLQETADAGVIYTCARNYTNRGNRVLNNYIHDISDKTFDQLDSGRHAIYLDDMTSGAVVMDNVVDGSPSAALIGGGWDNLIEGNVFLNCNKGLQYDCRASVTRNGTHSSSITPPAGETYLNTQKSFDRISQGGYTDIWTERYPAFMTEFLPMFNQFAGGQVTAETDIGIPRNNVLCSNTYAGPHAQESGYQKLYSGIVWSPFQVYSFTGDGNIEEATVKTTDISSVAYADKIAQAGLLSQETEPSGGMVMEHQQAEVTANGVPVVSFGDEKGKTVQLQAQYSIDVLTEEISIDYFAVFHENGTIIGVDSWTQTMAGNVVTAERTLSVPQKAGDQTQLVLYAWEHGTMQPLSDVWILPERDWIVLDEIRAVKDMVQVSGKLVPCIQGVPVLLRVTQGAAAWDNVLEDLSKLEKIDQTQTDENGEFTFLFRLKDAEQAGNLKIYIRSNGMEAEMLLGDMLVQ